MSTADGPQGLGTPSDHQPGIGTPSADHPSFTPAPGAPSSDHPRFAAASATPVGSAQPQWAAPSEPASYVPAPPTGRGPQRERSTRVRLIAGGLAAALVLTAVASVLPLLARGITTAPAASAPATASGEPSRLVTVSPTPQPVDGVDVTGPDIARAAGFTTADGSGELTITRATWTSAGELAPPEGKRYLVLDVTVTRTAGNVPIEALAFRAQSADGTGVTPGFGPKLDRPLGGSMLTDDNPVSGQVGFVLAPGETTIELLDAGLLPVVALKVPGP